MPWLRVGDNAASDPRVWRVLAWFRRGAAVEQMVREADVIVCELFGFVGLCATVSAGQVTDYVIGYGTARQHGGTRTEVLLEHAVRAGYMEVVEVGEDAEPLWRIVDDEKFLHMRTQAELDWEAQRRADASNTSLTIRVRLRDGDGCRYCGRLVHWSDRRGDNGGTYDHRRPGEPATHMTYVVCCRKCNGIRGKDPNADERLPLMPAPENPHYGPETLLFFKNNSVPPTTDDSSDPAASRAARDANRQPGGERSSTREGAPAPVERSAETAGPRSAGTGFPGRVGNGSGRVPGRTSSDPQISADRAQRNSRRSRRGRPRKPSGQQPSK